MIGHYGYSYGGSVSYILSPPLVRFTWEEICIPASTGYLGRNLHLPLVRVTWEEICISLWLILSKYFYYL